MEHQWHGVEFAVAGQIGGDAFAATVMRQLLHVPAGIETGAGQLLRSECGALLTDTSAQGIAIVGWSDRAGMQRGVCGHAGRRALMEV